MRYCYHHICLDEQMYKQTDAADGQPENILLLLRLSGGKGIKLRQTGYYLQATYSPPLNTSSNS